jgi:hypothetical protein
MIRSFPEKELYAEGQLHRTQIRRPPFGLGYRLLALILCQQFISIFEVVSALSASWPGLSRP